MLNSLLGLIMLSFAIYGFIQLIKKPSFKKKMRDFINSDDDGDAKM